MNVFNYIRYGLVSLIIATVFLATLAYSITAQAFDDDREQIAKQLKRHEHAVERCLVGFRKGDEAAQQSGQVDLAASEAYLSVLDFPANDPRLAGHLYDARMAESPANVSEFSSRLFHYRLKQRTGFTVDFDAVINSKALSDVMAH